MSIKKCYACEKRTKNYIETSRDIYLCMSCHDEEKFNAQREIEDMYEEPYPLASWEADENFLLGEPGNDY